MSLVDPNSNCDSAFPEEIYEASHGSLWAFKSMSNWYHHWWINILPWIKFDLNVTVSFPASNWTFNILKSKHSLLLMHLFSFWTVTIYKIKIDILMPVCWDWLSHSQVMCIAFKADFTVERTKGISPPYEGACILIDGIRGDLEDCEMWKPGIAASLVSTLEAFGLFAEVSPDDRVL